MRSKAEAGIHLLDAARALRTEKDKERDLVLQEEQEREIISRLQVGAFVNPTVGTLGELILATNFDITDESAAIGTGTADTEEGRARGHG